MSQFVLVHVMVKNIGKEAQTFDDGNQTLRDTDGREFDADSEAGAYLDDSNVPQRHQPFEESRRFSLPVSLACASRGEGLVGLGRRFGSPGNCPATVWLVYAARRRRLIAAVRSRSWMVPHGQVQVLSARVRSRFTAPHELHVLLDGNHRSATTTVEPYQSAL
ncbi:hypothetical protein KDY119_01152 [Luteimicrobium xylanilyticum]|uniref:DUF4352 domain-containing protein n=1 Tax=Luteimicrobium xylanilyticum TaxID=1133546 RepID=A0A5P9Q888_9MICO|nr:hypothetical protein KDY119_01152 [Luteimicrobium xylanilyticum]